MKNTKWLRRALLGGAALSVMATGAQADELSALKAQLEALQSRVSQLESQPAPQLPEGTKLLTVRRGQGTYSMLAPEHASDRIQPEQGYTIAVTPTADMPAPVSEVTVSGEIRVRALYRTYELNDDSLDLDADLVSDLPQEETGFEADDFDITTRARLRVDGKTETAIGEIGGTIRLQGTRNGTGDVFGADSGSDFSLNIGWGYWQMTPNLQLGGGYWDSLAAIQAGWDWNGEPALVGLNAGPTNESVSQVRLTYSSGPLTAAISVEDNNNRDADDCDWGCGIFTLNEAVFPAVAGFITFDSGSFLVTASAVWEQDDTDENNPSNVGRFFVDTDDNWMVGVGAILKLSDMFRLEAAANVGEGYTGGTYALQNTWENDMEYWGVNVMGVVSFHEGMRAELGFAFSDLDHENDELCSFGFNNLGGPSGPNCNDQVDRQWTAAASLFWDPVDQLTLGAGVGFTRRESTESPRCCDDGDGETDEVTAGLGAWFRF
jgi:hypothetical protein